MSQDFPHASLVEGVRFTAQIGVPNVLLGLFNKRELPGRLYDLLPEHVRQNAQFLLLLQRLLDPNVAGRFATAEEAEVGSTGLAMLHKQLTLAGKDTDYGRELENYLSKIVNPLGPA